MLPLLFTYRQAGWLTADFAIAILAAGWLWAEFRKDAASRAADGGYLEAPRRTTHAWSHPDACAAPDRELAGCGASDTTGAAADRMQRQRLRPPLAPSIPTHHPS